MPDNFRVYSAGPLTLIALIAVIGLIIIVVPLLFLGLAGKAITGLVGLSWFTATALVILILLCSFVDIPVWKITRTTIRVPHSENGQFPDAFTPDHDGGLWETTIAINVGGAVIPLALSIYLLDRVSLVTSGNMLSLNVLAGILIVAVMSYVTTRPMVGVGIRAPLFIPGLTALLCGFILAGGPGLSAGVIAFTSVTVGTLIGANIAHLYRAGDLEVAKISIGGAGTFAAIFIGCLLSALIA
jgi:uncharacterized membrane protein